MPEQQLIGDLILLLLAIGLLGFVLVVLGWGYLGYKLWIAPLRRLAHRRAPRSIVDERRR